MIGHPWALVVSVLFVPFAALAGGKISPHLFEEQAVWGALSKGAADKNAPEITKIVDTKVSITGWVIPNEYESGELTSFLLTRYPGGCVHVPLPPPDTVVHVTMASASTKLRDVSSVEKVVVQGVLRRGNRTDSYYEFEADSIRYYEP